jgi:hypothetical protein
MATIKTNDMRVQDASNLIKDITDNPYYFFIGKPTAWSDPNNSLITESNPPKPENSVSFFSSVMHEIMSLKKISETNVVHLVNRNVWTTGTVYDMYRHDYSSRISASSGSTDLAGALFYVINSQNSVYACLYNGVSPTNPRGIVSTVEPLSRDQEAFYTSDGYQWIYLYTIVSSNLSDYSTENFIPVPGYVFTPKNGEINTVVIDNAGTGYTSTPSGVADSVPYYFCNITGDGSGAVARVVVQTGRINRIEIVRPGQNYTYGNLNFTSGFIYRTLQDLDNRTNGLDPLGNLDFRSTVIISPSGGWGKDLPKQLISTKVGIFTDLEFDTSDFINDVSFRQLGVLTNIEYTDESYEGNSTLAAHDALCVGTSSSGADSYDLGEEITQEVTDQFGETVIARGIVIGWNLSTGVVRYIQNPRSHQHTDGNMYKFSSEGGPLIGLDSGTTGDIFTTFNSTTDGRLFQGGYSESEYKRFSGRLIYVSNISPVQRDPQQIERISLVISY